MSFGLSSLGFNRMLESDIRQAIVQDVAPLFDVDPNTVDWPNTDTPVSQLISPFSRQLGIVWELLEAAFEGLDPAQAFGTLLDGLLALNNLARLEATSTAVPAAISGTEGTVVPSSNRVSLSGSAALFQAVAAATITKANQIRTNVQVAGVSNIGVAYTVTINGHVISSGALGGSPTRDSIAFQLITAIMANSLVNQVVEAVLFGTATLQVSSVANSTTYSVTLDGTTFSYVSDASATDVEIVNGLVAAISAGGFFAAVALTNNSFSVAPNLAGSDWSLALSARLAVLTLTATGAFAVKSADLVVPFSIDVDSRMAIDKLFTPQAYAAVATGAIEAPAGTLIHIETPLSGLSAVTNFLDGVVGRDVEADDAARVRRQDTLSTGSSQIAAMLSQLNRIVGVTLARVYENINDNPDAESRPGHSVEALVIGGADADIAAVVWATRSAGIKPFGNVNADGTLDPDGDGTGVTIKDSNGFDQVVHFSRPEPRYAWVYAALTLYSEEDFPAEGLAAVRDAILVFGNSLGIGKDFLLQRFVGPCVNIPGVGRVDLRIAVGVDPDTMPAGFPSTPSPATWQVDIAVGSRQVLVFDTTRITVV